MTTDGNGIRTASLVVVGLGYVGLPLCSAAVDAGHKVIGLEIDSDRVAMLNRGRSPLHEFPHSRISAMSDAGFEATADPACIASADVVVICVPTPLDDAGHPDLTALTGAVATVASNATTGTLVTLESTTYPGTTEEVLAPALEAAGHRVGADVWVAFSPERIDPGNPTFALADIPKVVGGVTAECSRRAVEFYRGLVNEVVVARGPREAEMAKLLENTYRQVNIALVNEISIACNALDIDFWDVARCAATKPFGFQRFNPGPGVGGHCIPVDPSYLNSAVQKQLGYSLRLVEAAQSVNREMPHYVVRRVRELIGSEDGPCVGARVLVVGVTYKANVADQRSSPALPIAEELVDLGIELTYYDPLVPQWTVNNRAVPAYGAADSDGFDVVLFLVHHAAVDPQPLVQRGRNVLDTRGVLLGPTVTQL